MKVERVTLDAIAEILGWRHVRGLPPWPDNWLSDSGFWVPGMAAAWLYTSNSSRCFLEDAVTNPGAEKIESGQALELVTDHICELARQLGFRYICGTTMLQAVRDRAERNGFVNSDAKFSLHLKRLQ